MEYISMILMIQLTFQFSCWQVIPVEFNIIQLIKENKTYFKVNLSCLAYRATKPIKILNEVFKQINQWNLFKKQ